MSAKKREYRRAVPRATHGRRARNGADPGKKKATPEYFILVRYFPSYIFFHLFRFFFVILVFFSSKRTLQRTSTGVEGGNSYSFFFFRYPVYFFSFIFVRIPLIRCTAYLCSPPGLNEAM